MKLIFSFSIGIYFEVMQYFREIAQKTGFIDINFGADKQLNLSIRAEVTKGQLRSIVEKIILAARHAGRANVTLGYDVN